MLNKHLLRKTQNFFCPLCIFKGRSLFPRLLKLAFFARRTSQSAFNNFICSLRFRPKVQDLLEAINLWSPKSTRINTVQFWWVIFSQHVANSSKSWLSSTPTAFASYKTLINTSSNENILFLNFTTNSLIYVFCNQHCVLSIPNCAGFPVHGWNLLPIMFRYWVSIVLRIGWVLGPRKWNQLFPIYCRVEASLDFFSRCTWVLPKSQLYRISSPCMARALPSLWSFTVATRANG